MLTVARRHHRRDQTHADHGFQTHQEDSEGHSAAETSANDESAERGDRERPLRVFGDELAQLLTCLSFLMLHDRFPIARPVYLRSVSFYRRLSPFNMRATR